MKTPKLKIVLFFSSVLFAVFLSFFYILSSKTFGASFCGISLSGIPPYYDDNSNSVTINATLSDEGVKNGYILWLGGTKKLDQKIGTQASDSVIFNLNFSGNVSIGEVNSVALQECQDPACNTFWPANDNCKQQFCVYKDQPTECPSISFTTVKDPYKLCGTENPTHNPNFDATAYQKCVECLSENPTLADFKFSETKSWTSLGCIDSSVQGIATWVFNNIYYFIGGIAFLLMLYGVFIIITSSGNPEKLNEGKSIIIAALTGLIFALFIAFIIKIVGIDILGLPDFSFTKP